MYLLEDESNYKMFDLLNRRTYGFLHATHTTSLTPPASHPSQVQPAEQGVHVHDRHVEPAVRPQRRALLRRDAEKEPSRDPRSHRPASPHLRRALLRRDATGRRRLRVQHERGFEMGSHVPSTCAGLSAPRRCTGTARTRRAPSTAPATATRSARTTSSGSPARRTRRTGTDGAAKHVFIHMVYTPSRSCSSAPIPSSTGEPGGLEPVADRPERGPRQVRHAGCPPPT